ncbi:MAG: SAF domain-containing protein [Actinomycetota bacterium]
MSVSERSSLRSPFRSPATFASAIHARARRHRLGRVAVLAAIGTIVCLRLFAAIDAADRERARWAPSRPVWVTTADVAAGERLDAERIASAEVPDGLLPAATTIEDPTGRRVRVDLAAGEIITDPRLAGAESEHAARTPPGTVAVALDRSSDLFTVGDRVDLHDQVDGGRLVASALVVAVTDGDVAVAVERAAVAEVIRSLGRAGVVVVLRGD